MSIMKINPIGTTSNGNQYKKSYNGRIGALIDKHINKKRAAKVDQQALAAAANGIDKQ